MHILSSLSSHLHTIISLEIPFPKNPELGYEIDLGSLKSLEKRVYAVWEVGDQKHTYWTTNTINPHQYLSGKGKRK